MKLEGRIALVTGATRNIGRAIALRLARDGASVGVNGVSNKAGVDETVSLINKEGGKAVPLMADVSDPKQVEDMVKAAEHELGTIDLLVSNAAIRPHIPFSEMTPEHWRKIMGVNLDASFYLSRLLIPGMVDKNQGTVIVISGLAAFGVRGGALANATAKAGLLGMIRAIASGFGPQGIRAHALVLGSMLTEDYDQQAYLSGQPSQSLGRGLRSHNTEPIPLRRRGTPEEVAAACAFLASEDSGYITGQAIHLNGGLYMA